MVRSARLFALTLVIVAAPAARADFFSPGDLAHPHASFSGLKNCTLCHPGGQQQLSQDRCLDCHKELAPSIKAHTGFHGRIPDAKRDCQTCHHDHKGDDFQMVEWGAGGKKGFDHASTGWALKGKHATTSCDDCHTPKLIKQVLIAELLRKHPEENTYLGLPTRCDACHFDEHRGQASPDCETCHNEKKWKPAPGFDHAKTEYPLTGKHVEVACAKCHTSQEDTTTPANVFPSPLERNFLVFKGLEFSKCTDCHKDPHDNRFGPRCESCHTTAGWKIIHSAKDERAFHAKTRFPLVGAHETVDCKACHGPWPGTPAKFKGLAFAKCTDCHADAHEGQLGASPVCTKCHDQEAFKPAKFDLPEHAKSKYPLEEAHQAVACLGCHAKDETLIEQVPISVRRDLERKHRPQAFCLARYAVKGTLSDCRTCHQDPHGDQFTQRGAKDGCAGCHQLSSFRDVTFDHQKDSRFALTGKHADLQCAQCHTAAPGSTRVRYRPLNMACVACHADVHAGQFAPSPGQPTDCAKCHGTQEWKTTPFKHEPPFTTFLLEGKHADVACEKCHTPVEVAAGAKAVRYKGTPTACVACHQDPHNGEFKGFEP